VSLRSTRPDGLRNKGDLVQRRRLLLASAAIGGLLAGRTAAAPSPAAAAAAAQNTAGPACGALERVHTVGRVEPVGDHVQYTWPGIYFEARFRGTGIGVVLDDAVNDYDVAIDGASVATLVTPGRTTSWVNGLARGEHTVRLVKRTESAWAAGRFGGFVPAPGGALLAATPARPRQIEFIGDSYTVGYGNMSDTRDCSANGGVDRNTDADLGFAAQSARSLGADYQINAMSGMGMVRNYGGGGAGTDFRTYYGRTLQAASTEPWRAPRAWRPQLVVIGLGINDFSTALNPGEQWATPDQLAADYTAAYQGFLDLLRAAYGPRTFIVVSAAALSNTALFAQSAQQIVQNRNSRGDRRVSYWYYDSPHFDRLGCDWHPSVHDDGIISGLLNAYIATLPLRW
jgi:lysophospholipase L1-like esterase